MKLNNNSHIKSHDPQRVKFIENVIHDLKSTDSDNPFKDLEASEPKTNIRRATA